MIYFSTYLVMTINLHVFQFTNTTKQCYLSIFWPNMILMSMAHAQHGQQKVWWLGFIFSPGNLLLGTWTCLLGWNLLEWWSFGYGSKVGSPIIGWLIFKIDQNRLTSVVPIVFNFDPYPRGQWENSHPTCNSSGDECCGSCGKRPATSGAWRWSHWARLEGKNHWELSENPKVWKKIPWKILKDLDFGSWISQ